MSRFGYLTYNSTVTRWLYYFYNIWPLTAKKICPSALEVYQIRHNFLPDIKWTFKFASLSKLCYNGEISANLVTLGCLVLTEGKSFVVEIDMFLCNFFYLSTYLLFSHVVKSKLSRQLDLITAKMMVWNLTSWRVWPDVDIKSSPKFSKKYVTAVFTIKRCLREIARKATNI